LSNMLQLSLQDEFNKNVLWYGIDNGILKSKFEYLLRTIRLVGPGVLFCVVAWSPVVAADPGGFTEERAWIDRATALVDIAATGQADGKTYTQDVRAHRADLRALMQGTGTDAPEARRQLHMSMVLMGVLLKTAAGCQSGGHVVCPASLMFQLRTVLKNTYIKLEASEGQSMAADSSGAMQ
jgi:hypothetical protein